MFNCTLRSACRSVYKSWINNERHFSLTSAVRSFDGEGKTTVNVLNNEADLGLMINGISQVGFRLNNDLTVLGAMAIFPRSVLSWNVQDVEEITDESLSLFTILEPKIDILVVGVGDKLQDLSIYKKLHPFSIKHKINLEVLPTEQACSTFNFLNSEGRSVAAALIPPKTLAATDDDIAKSKQRYQNLYQIYD